MASSMQPNVSIRVSFEFLYLLIFPQSQKSGSQKMGDSMTSDSSGNNVGPFVY